MQGLLICNYSAADKGTAFRRAGKDRVRGAGIAEMLRGVRIIGNASYSKTKAFGLRCYKRFVNA